MEIIEDYKQIRELATDIKSYKEGFITNFFISELSCNLLIEKELIYKMVFGKCVFILYKDHDFYHIYYLATVKSELSDGLRQLVKQCTNETFVADIVGTEADTEQISELFAQAGFGTYTKLFRMSRTKGLDSPQTLNPDVKYADLAQATNIKNILETYFDKYSEQIPLLADIEQWIENKRVIALTEKELIIGLAIFEIIGLTSYLRYWFTHPAYRGRGVGSVMLRRFFYECRHTKRQLFWVIASNENAIARYKHYGFEQEPMVDVVMKK